MSIPYPFPYQGSKRKLALAILALFPEHIDTLFEPFAGSAAVSIAAAYHNRAKHFVLNDTNAPLMALWDRVLNHPDDLAQDYERLWKAQQGHEKEYYFEIRDHFNQKQQPHYLLFLLVRCVKAAVRYNTRGEFNQSPDNRRKGTQPQRMRAQIMTTSRYLANRTTLLSLDYREVVRQARPTDLIYMDPPYQGVCCTRDPRYYEPLDYDVFVDTLGILNRRGLRYIVSYDGRTGSKSHGTSLPKHLGLTWIEINAGRSSQATLLGRDQITYESLYLSPALHAQIGGSSGYRQLSRDTSTQLRLPL